jgi:hypothetical protein
MSRNWHQGNEKETGRPAIKQIKIKINEKNRFSNFGNSVIL